MNKKQKNRKQVLQNTRNRILNKKYVSTIKTFTKLFIYKKKCYDLNLNSTLLIDNKNLIQKNKLELKSLTNKIYSVIDKAVKKNILHKNNGGRKKAKIGKLFNQLM